MKLRARTLGLTLAMALAALGLASCASDSVDLTSADSKVGTASDAYFGYDPLFYDTYYDSDLWPFYRFRSFSGHDHFGGHQFHGFHSPGGQFSGHR